MNYPFATARYKARIERAHEAFLKWPMPVVLALLWLVRTMLMSLCATTLYLSWMLLQAAA